MFYPELFKTPVDILTIHCIVYFMNRDGFTA